MAISVPIRLEGHTCEAVGATLGGHVVGVGHNGLSGLTNRLLVQRNTPYNNTVEPNPGVSAVCNNSMNNAGVGAMGQVTKPNSKTVVAQCNVQRKHKHCSLREWVGG